MSTATPVPRFVALDLAHDIQLLPLAAPWPDSTPGLLGHARRTQPHLSAVRLDARGVPRARRDTEPADGTLVADPMGRQRSRPRGPGAPQRTLGAGAPGAAVGLDAER